MGRKDYKFHYAFNPSSGDIIKAKVTNISVHFKNTVETANQIRGMKLARANSYLKNVISRKECVPFKKFRGGIGKCGQAKQFKCTIGRWPQKSAKILIDLLNNAVANCEYMGNDPEEFLIGHIQVNPAPVRTRRTYRAHGRINPYERHLSHIQIVLVEAKPKTTA